MKSLKEYVHEDQINEVSGNPIDDYWLNNNKPVMTKDGRKVKILDIDITKVPNVISGEVTMQNGKKFNYEWEDNGTCVTATDNIGNPKKPDENDNLVKAC